MSNQRRVRHTRTRVHADRVRDAVSREVAALSPPPPPEPLRPAEPTRRPRSANPSLTPDRRGLVLGLEWIGLALNLALPVIVWSSMIHVSNATARTTAGWTFLTVAVNCLLHLVATIGLRGESGGVRSLAVTNLVGAVLNAGWWFAVALLAAVLGVMADAT